MGSFGGSSFAGGTATFGGGDDAETRWSALLIRWLGQGAYNPVSFDDAVRTRFLQALAEGMCAIENEGIKGALESVPAWAIDQLDEWERIYGLDLVRVTWGHTQVRQEFLRICQVFLANTCNYKRVQTELRKLLNLVQPLMGTKPTAYENTVATALSEEGLRYWCLLVPYSEGFPHTGAWLTAPTQRPFYRAVKALLRTIAPAHTVVALCTSDEQVPARRPAFYSDGYRGSASDKDVVGS